MAVSLKCDLRKLDCKLYRKSLFLISYRFLQGLVGMLLKLTNLFMLMSLKRLEYTTLDDFP